MQLIVFFISGHSGVLVNARGNVDQFRAIAPGQLEIKDTIIEVKYGCLLTLEVIDKKRV